MKKNISYLIVSVIFLTQIVQAQPYSRERGKDVIYTEGSKIVQIIRSDEVSGTPFYRDDFTRGKVILGENKVSQTFLMDFNTFKEHLIIKKNETYEVFTPREMTGFVFLNDKDEVEEYFRKGFYNPELDISPTTYVKVIYDGDVKLIVHHQVTYKTENYTRIVEDAASNEYKSTLTYYIVRENGEYKKTKPRAKNLIKDLGKFEKELKSYTKKNKLKGRSDKDIALILSHFDDLNKTNQES